MPKERGAKGRASIAALVWIGGIVGWDPGWCTETEHYDVSILPASRPIHVEGREDDWDLSAGVFVCGDVERQREEYGVWVHALWDPTNLYLLARWHDPTPLSHPGSVRGDYGFNGDCLQVRIVTAPEDLLEEAAGGRDLRQEDDLPRTRTSHLTAWRDRDGRDALQITWGHRFNEGGCDAKDHGGQQAFRVWDDARGYTQEIAIPWSLLSRDGWKPTAGARIAFTVEANFLTRTGGRLSLKDIFRPNTAIDRIFTFSAVRCWGWGRLAREGQKTPRPVRLRDGRTFPVHLADGLPVVDWTGLTVSHEPEGFLDLRFSLEEEGYVSLNIFQADGTVARQLLTGHFYSQGNHEVRWDGLTTPSAGVPGQPVEPGEYTWRGLWHPGVRLILVGWAGSTSETPWGKVWGGDHGDPCAVAADAERVYLGWSGGEGTQPLQACTPDGRILWKQIRGGIATASLVGVGDGTVYVWNEHGQYAPRSLYRVDAATGRYTPWEGTDSPDLDVRQLFPGEASPPERPDSLCAGRGAVFLGFRARHQVVAIDAQSGRRTASWTVPLVGDLELDPQRRLMAVSGTDAVVSIEVSSGTVTSLAKLPLEREDALSALAVDADGDVYCGIQGEHHYVQVLSSEGRPLRTIGVRAGRRRVGPWQPEGMYRIAGLAVDGRGQLWVAERDGLPRRVSVWNAKRGTFVREFFGATSYGALGGAVNPVDPWLMVGQGCEWRLDPTTGVARCLGTIDRHGMAVSRFGFSPDGRLFLAVTPSFLHGRGPIRFYEKRADGDWKLRARVEKDEKQRRILSWADENDDAKEQPEEVRTYPDTLGGWIQGWYLAITPDLTCYGSLKQVKVAEWTRCGAPRYDFSRATDLPGPPDGARRGGMGAQHNHGSADGRWVLWNGLYGEDHSTFDCYDLTTGQWRWSYPNNFTGVHGSHRAPPAAPGLIRGAYDICGSVTLPRPIGNIWVIPTNKGEWHVLTEEGFYLTSLWEGDPMRMAFPERAIPGADCTHCPPGAGEEAFGGSVTLDRQGRLFLQGGHTSFWNVQVRGLERVRALVGGKLTVTSADVKKAEEYRRRWLACREGRKRWKVPRRTPTFSGDLTHDFGEAAVRDVSRSASARVRAALAWDETALFAGWEVADDTPWQNGADAPEFLYARGDTVDLQLGMDPHADSERSHAAPGDLRLSLGPYQGRPTAVLYREKVTAADRPQPRKFSSGVYPDGVWVESVTFPDTVRVYVAAAEDRRRYTVEAAVPWAVLGGRPEPGQSFRGDLGVTYGDREGRDTVLRVYWANPETGIVSDEVEELLLKPRNWGELALQP